MSLSGRQHHWDEIYTTTAIDQTGWYEADPAVSIALIERTGVGHADRIVDVGSGNSTLIPALIQRGYRNIAAVDLSRVALEALRRRLGDDAQYVDFICDDVSELAKRMTPGSAALWHDRAMLHFLTDVEERERYSAAFDAVVAAGGQAIIGVFADDGAERCSGLPVERYDETMLDAVAGPTFARAESLRTTYVQPWGGLRPYVYARYERVGGGPV